MRRHGMKSHYLEKKSAKRKRDFGSEQAVAPSDVAEVSKLLGRGS
jgi:ribosomal protein L35